jgi:hypothetical protein
MEWSEVMRDLAQVREIEVRHRDKHYVLRPSLKGGAGKVFQTVGVAIPPPARETPRGAKTDGQAL